MKSPVLTLYVSLLIGILASSVHSAIFSANDARYTNWPKLYTGDSYVRIPVYIDTAKYAANPTCLGYINSAIAQMNSDLLGCIQFVPIASPNSVGHDFLWISTTLQTGAVADTCQSFPGRVISQVGNGQKLLILPPGTTTVGPTCCSSVREVMRYLAHTLGQRNEYQRADRPITVIDAAINTSLTAFNMYKPYSTSVYVASPYSPAFDFNSITMVSTDKFSSAAGTAVWTPTTAGAVPGTLARLSAADCSGIAWKYSCGGYCQDPYG